jgi:hypothetical protein
MPVVYLALRRPAAQYVYQYDSLYHVHGEWGWYDPGLHRGWSKHGRGQASGVATIARIAAIIAPAELTD